MVSIRLVCLALEAKIIKYIMIWESKAKYSKYRGLVKLGRLLWPMQLRCESGTPMGLSLDTIHPYLGEQDPLPSSMQLNDTVAVFTCVRGCVRGGRKNVV